MKDTEMKVGDKINDLTMIEPSYTYGKKSRRYAKFQCDCGNIKTIRVYNVTSESTKSCGCKKHINMTPRNIKHGLCYSRLYNIWRKMIYRCKSKSYHEYEYYGGRGIKVCEEWENNFLTFYNWAINNGYKDNLSIDRINTNGNYTPDNCKWSTSEEQGNNKRNNINITINDKTQTLAQWCKELNLKYTTVLMRIKRGWSYEEALEK